MSYYLKLLDIIIAIILRVTSRLSKKNIIKLRFSVPSLLIAVNLNHPEPNNKSKTMMASVVSRNIGKNKNCLTFGSTFVVGTEVVG
jgi:hypothetical protein